MHPAVRRASAIPTAAHKLVTAEIAREGLEAPAEFPHLRHAQMLRTTGIPACSNRLYQCTRPNCHEKNTARLMYRMVEDINKNYVSMVPKHDKDDKAEKSDAMVTCGTCHRGNLHPPAYVPPKHEEHEHPASPAGEAKP